MEQQIKMKAKMELLERDEVKMKAHFENLYNCSSCSPSKDALFSIPTNKSPDPDGITTYIYQYHWETMHSDRFQYILRALNHTHITLIPKRVGSTSLDDY